MAVATGNIEYKYQKTFVKVFHVNIENLEKELNDWIKSNEEKYEIVDINLLGDGQNEVIAIAVCHHADVNRD